MKAAKLLANTDQKTRFLRRLKFLAHGCASDELCQCWSFWENRTQFGLLLCLWTRQSHWCRLRFHSAPRAKATERPSFAPLLAAAAWSSPSGHDVAAAPTVDCCYYCSVVDVEGSCFTFRAGQESHSTSGSTLSKSNQSSQLLFFVTPLTPR